MTTINVHGLVKVDGGEVRMDPSARWADPSDIIKALNVAWACGDDPLLAEAYHGGRGPLFDLGEITLERYYEIREQLRIAQAGKDAKATHVASRRRDFARERSDLVLALLDSGVPYVCAREGCSVSVDLTLDHKRALSRGGSDDPNNLQFLCRYHNSAKSDRVEG